MDLLSPEWCSPNGWSFCFVFNIFSLFPLSHWSYPQGTEDYSGKFSLPQRGTLFWTLWSVRREYIEQRVKWASLHIWATEIQYKTKLLAVQHINLLSVWMLELSWLLYHHSNGDVSTVWVIYEIKEEKHWLQDIQCAYQQLACTLWMVDIYWGYTYCYVFMLNIYAAFGTFFFWVWANYPVIEI